MMKFSFLVLVLSVGCTSIEKNPATRPQTTYSEEIVYVQSSRDSIIKFQTTIFQPKKEDSSKPIVIINHGTNPVGRQHRERAIHPTEFFLSICDKIN